MVEHLPSMCKALGSTPSRKEEEGKKEKGEEGGEGEGRGEGLKAAFSSTVHTFLVYSYNCTTLLVSSLILRRGTAETHSTAIIHYFLKCKGGNRYKFSETIPKKHLALVPNKAFSWLGSTETHAPVRWDWYTLAPPTRSRRNYQPFLSILALLWTESALLARLPPADTLWLRPEAGGEAQRDFPGSGDSSFLFWPVASCLLCVSEACVSLTWSLQLLVYLLVSLS